MLKMRMMFGLIAMVMVLALAQTGYSQLTITVTSTPNPTADSVGFTEPTYNPTQGYSGLVITGSVLSDAPFTGGRLRITYPSAVTNACTAASSTSSTGCNAVAATNGAGSVNGPGQNVPGIAPGVAGNTTAGIQLTLADGVFTGAQVAKVDAAAGTVDVTLPCTTSNIAGVAALWNGGAHIQGATGTMILTGVRIDATSVSSFPATAALSISTSSSSTGIPNSTPGGGGTAECANNVGAGTNVQLATTSIPVITAASAGIGAVAIGGIPTSVSQPSAANAANSGVVATGAANTGCNTSSGAFYINCGVATVYTNKNIPKLNGTFTVKEGFADAWYHNDASEFSGQDLTNGGPGFTGTNDASFQLTFNNIPAGVTLTLATASFTGAANSGTNVAANPPTLNNAATATITTANNTVVVRWGGDLDPTKTDWVTFEITNIQVSSTATLSAGSITVSAQMWPIESTGLNLANGTGSSQIWGASNGQFPVFVSSIVSGPTVVTIVPANTTFLIPFAVASGGYDTGIAISNTSVDPFGAQGATPQAGTMQVNLYPSTATGAGTGVSFTTSATKLAGTGIAADGTIPAGATWTVNLSQLLPLAGQTGGFIGYIFIQANFLPGHGAAYVYNGAGFTSSTPVLVLPPPSTNGRGGNFANGAESLDF